MNDKGLYIFGVLLVIVAVFALAIPVSFAVNIPAAPASYQSTESHLSPDLLLTIPYVVGGLLAIWIIVAMIRSGRGVALLVIVLVVGAAWFFLAGDKTGDGIGDNQIIAVVQPRGDNPSWDSQYATTNKENATANVITAASFSVYAVTVVLLGLGISLLFIILKSRG